VFNAVGFVTKESQVNSTQQDGPETDKAFTDINLTLFEDTVIYERTTNTNPTEIPPELENARRTEVIVTLTTHSDLMLTFFGEFYADQWNDSITLFKNSTLVNRYENFEPLKRLVPDVDNITLLELTRSSLRIEARNETPSNLFIIEQSIILRQSTAFILALHEIFQFDRNKIELSQITDFFLRSEYVSFEGDEFKHNSESVRIKAPSTILDYITHRKGYSGRIYLSNWEEPEPVPPYFRGYGVIPQEIRVSITLPTGQNEVSYKFDINYTQEVSTSEFDIVNSKNSISIMFPSDSYLPYYIDLDSSTPLLEQFSLSDYFSMAIGAFAGLFTLLKGLPYYLNRRSFNKYKKALHLASEKGTTTDFENIQAEIKDKFLQRKLSASQLEDIKKEIQYLRKSEGIKKLQPEETKAPSLEDLLGKESS
ncbi:MAG: hypothetical protein ACXACU_11465, partial [Candidatus Hodarchaeales archaeon]